MVMQLLHGSNDRLPHCAFAALAYVCLNSDDGNDKQPAAPVRRTEPTMAYATNIRTGHYSLADRAAAMVASARDALERRRIYRQTLRELSALSSRELGDLGINHSMITRVALEAANRK